VAEQTALEQARKVIHMRASDPKAKMLGISGDLQVIGRALDELESNADTICAALLSHIGKHHPNFEFLASIGPKTRARLHVLKHGPRCTCMECMPPQRVPR